MTAPSSAARTANPRASMRRPAWPARRPAPSSPMACTGSCGDAMMNGRSMRRQAAVGTEPVSIWIRARAPRVLGAVGRTRRGARTSGGTSDGAVADEPHAQGGMGHAADDVFAVGKNAIVHWNGAGWTRMALNASGPVGLMGVWGSSSATCSRWASQKLKRAWYSTGTDDLAASDAGAAGHGLPVHVGLGQRSR